MILRNQHVSGQALRGGRGNDTLKGGTGIDTLHGEGGNDILKGDTGADRMFGGSGNDKYFVDSTGDRVSEGTNRSKADSIHSTISVKLASAAFGSGQIEQVFLLGTKAINATGTAGANSLTGNSAANVLIGGGGLDKLNGGGGNDLLIVPDFGFASAAGGAGQDTLKFTGASLTINLTQISDSKITGFEIIDIAGSGDNKLVLTMSEAISLAPAGTLIVEGNAGDAVDLDVRLKAEGTIVVGAETYNAFKAGSMNVLIDQTVAVNPIVASVIDLSTLNGFNGFRLIGAQSFDYAGVSVSSAGDVNGDGIDDFIIGATGANAGAKDSGATYVVFGGTSNFSALDAKDGSFDGHIDLGKLDGTTGFRLAGVATSDHSGRSVSAAGDVNGDGFGDILIGAPSADPSGIYSGSAYIIFGKSRAIADSW